MQRLLLIWQGDGAPILRKIIAEILYIAEIATDLTGRWGSYPQKSIAEIIYISEIATDLAGRWGSYS